MGKIVVFGQAPFGAKVFEGLLAAGHQVTAVCAPKAREGAGADPLVAAAQAAGVRTLTRASYKGEEAAAEVAAAEADLGLLAYVTQIIPRELLDAPRLGSICFHPSLLPKYRGGSAIPWQLIRGESTGGVTLFRPDEGVDTGPIYLQREVEIGPDESAGSFYYAKIFDLGVQATLESVELLLSGKAEGLVQDEDAASHDPLCRHEHGLIDWNRPSAELHNLVRGCDPAPGAHCRAGSTVLRVYGSRRAASSTTEKPGTVLSIGSEGMEVACADGTLRFAKLNAGAGKGPAAEVAPVVEIKVGDRLHRGLPAL